MEQYLRRKKSFGASQSVTRPPVGLLGRFRTRRKNSFPHRSQNFCGSGVRGLGIRNYLRLSFDKAIIAEVSQHSGKPISQAGNTGEGAARLLVVADDPFCV